MPTEAHVQPVIEQSVLRCAVDVLGAASEGGAVFSNSRLDRVSIMLQMKRFARGAVLGVCITGMAAVTGCGGSDGVTDERYMPDRATGYISVNVQHVHDSPIAKGIISMFG